MNINVNLILMYVCIFIIASNVIMLFFDISKWIIGIIDKIKPSTADAGYKYDRCNNILGITNNRTYFCYKFFFACMPLFVAVFMDIPLIFRILCLGVVPFFFSVPDILMFLSKQGREKSITNEIPKVITAIKNFSGSYEISDYLIYAAQNTTGPLRKELVRLNAIYSTESDFEALMVDFKKRLNVPTADALEMAIRDKYYVGVYENVNVNKNLIRKEKAISAEKAKNLLCSVTFVLSFISSFAVIFLLFICPVIMG